MIRCRRGSLGGGSSAFNLAGLPSISGRLFGAGRTQKLGNYLDCQPESTLELVFKGRLTNAMDWKKLWWTFPIGIITGLYTTLVLQQRWNWFVVSPFHLGSISFWQTYGLVLIVDMFASRLGGAAEAQQEGRWNLLYKILDYCVPSDRMEALKDEMKAQQEIVYIQLGLHAFSNLVGITTTFAVAWVVHSLA